MIALSSKAVIGLGFAAIFAQVVPPLAGAPPANSATQWTLEGALVIAVGFLARAVVALTKMNASDRATYAAALERKDEQIVAMVVKVTDAVVTNNHGMQASNANIERNSADIQEVKTAVMSLSSAMHSIQVRRA